MSVRKRRWVQLLLVLAFAFGVEQVNDMLVREEIAAVKSPRRDFASIPLEEFDWPEAGMSVELPGVPTEVQRDVEKFGVVLPFSGRSAFDGAVSYMAGFVDYPLDLPLPATAEDLVEMGHWQTDALPSEEIVVKPLEWGKYIGIDARKSGDPGSRFATRFRLILVGRRGYVLTVTGLSPLEVPNVDRFFESFRLLDEP